MIENNIEDVQVVEEVAQEQSVNDTVIENMDNRTLANVVADKSRIGGAIFGRVVACLRASGRTGEGAWPSPKMSSQHSAHGRRISTQ